MKQNYLILLLAAAALWSCDDDTATSEQPQTTESKPMSFSFTAKSYEAPSGIGTRSSGISDLLEDVSISKMLGDGILLSCYNVTGDSVLFSNYVYMAGEDAVGAFSDSVGNSVDTPMWPGSDKVIFYAYYNGGGKYYFEEDWGTYDYTIRKNESGHWCFGMNNSNMNGGADFMACIDTTSCDESATVQLNMKHILTKFRVTAWRAAKTDSINITSFSVYVPDTVVYDFNEGKVKRVANSKIDTINAIAGGSDSEAAGANTFEAYTLDESGYTKYYQDSVVLTTTVYEDNYWYLAVPDSLVFDFGYQMIYKTTVGDTLSVSATVNPTAGQKIIYNVTLPGQSSTTIDEGTVGTGAN